MLQRRPNGHSGAKKWRGGGVVKIFWDLQNKVLFDHNILGVAAIAFFAVVVTAVVGLDIAGSAVVFHAALARVAGATRVNEGSDSNPVANLELGDTVTNGSNLADDFVARNHWEDAFKPLVTNLVDVGVTNARVLDVDCNRICS